MKEIIPGAGGHESSTWPVQFQTVNMKHLLPQPSCVQPSLYLTLFLFEGLLKIGFQMPYFHTYPNLISIHVTLSYCSGFDSLLYLVSI